jgi:hypothetical protein
MIVLSHRGFWTCNAEKNSKSAFIRSFSAGYGTETDIRDCNGRLVISHDMPNESAMPLEYFFDIYKRYGITLPLALNVKADGMQSELKRLIDCYGIENYFCFDMAVPDAIMYCSHHLKAFTRQSEYELTPAFYEMAQGVWLDEFIGHWITNDVIARHMKSQKGICIVSPDLHNRDYRNEWEQYKGLESRIGKDRLMICTDFPDKAQEFFNAED